MPEPELTIEVRDSLAEIERDEWNALCDDGNPFLTYEFLYSLECTGCLGRHNGWYPRYFLLWQNSDAKQLVGAMPAYLKTNSYGEFVFDWAWAEAYERNNLPYYPKLVCSIPFTPCTGQRILVHPMLDRSTTIIMLANAARQFCHSEEYSSVHWLFITEAESDLISAAQGNDTGKDTDKDTGNDNDMDAGSSRDKTTPPSLSLLRRIDCQYHWRNDNYESGDTLLMQKSELKSAWAAHSLNRNGRGSMSFISRHLIENGATHLSQCNFLRGWAHCLVIPTRQKCRKSPLPVR